MYEKKMLVYSLEIILLLRDYMNTINRLICFLWIMMVCSIAAHAGKKIVVPTDYKKIQMAINETEEGDTVYVLKGTYKEKIVMEDNIVLMGENPDETILRGNRKDPVVKASNHSILRDFTIKQGGIGILSENTNLIIQNNIIRENTKTGIQCLISLPHIQNNIIADNEWSGVFCELVSYGTRTAIEHNIIVDNKNNGIMLSRKSGVLIQNNIFFRNQQYGVFVSKDSKKSRIIYNDFFMNRREYNNHAVVDATNILKDPQFPPIKWTSFDFLSKYKSPLHNLGKNGAPIGIVSKAGLKRLFKDSDEDAIADDEDRCPGIAEDFDGFNDEDGCPDYDNDEDGLYDKRDKCPDQAEDFDGFLDQDGCPDKDNDKDDVPDTIDKCPNRAETFNLYKDEDGCPDEKPREEGK